MYVVSSLKQFIPLKTELLSSIVLYTSTRPGQSVSRADCVMLSDAEIFFSQMQTLRPIPGAKSMSAFAVLRTSIATSGVRSLYTGVSASILRHMTYSLVRLGSYEKMKLSLSKDGHASSWRLLVAAMIAGGLGGVAGNPAGKLSAVRGQ
jgi:Mitochondrial carrier protein